MKNVAYDQKSAPVKRLPKSQVFLLKAISMLLPLLLLLVVEVLLRVFHYGHNLDLFIEFPGNKQFLVLNPDASKRYFTNQAIATTGNSELFKKEKAAHTVRIFVLGESTTIGYPYFHNGSFHRWLQYRLMHTFPDKNFEIINLALTAVNSYTVLGFAQEAVNYEPDAVLIYTGHNEYYGTLGVASTNTMGGSPMVVNVVLRLRQLRLVQLMTHLYEKMAGFSAGDSGGTRLKMMVAEGEIPYGSKLYERGIHQFQSNMDETLNLFHQRHIPVFISNLVSNEKDLKPFISSPVNSIQFPAFKKHYTLGLKAYERKEFSAAYQSFKEANKAYSAHALCNYYLGQLAYQQGDFTKAKTYFSKAKDLDGLRFRAPEQINEVIGEVCHKYPNTHLVDTKAEFEKWSGHQMIGNELVLEHVHPNLTGYALISEAFYAAMKKEKLIPVNQVKEMTFQELLQSMPVTKVDSLAGIYKANKLKTSWPFSAALRQDTFRVETQEEKWAWNVAFNRLSWRAATDSLYNYYLGSHQLNKARKVMEALVLEYSEDAAYYEKTAMLSGEMKDYANALFYFKKAFDLAPSFDQAKYLFVIYLKLDQPAEALPYLDYAIRHNTSHFNLLPVKASVVEIIRLKKKYARDSSNVFALSQIAQTYFRMDNTDGALLCVEKILQVDDKNKDALALLAQLKRE
jgi:tetratricopeptide (TPR) repeat protein